MAHKKGQGSTRNGRDSNPKYLGTKCFSNEIVWPGCIILRQRGTHFKPGRNVGIGRDHTIYAMAHGRVHFTESRRVSVLKEGE